MNTEEVSYLLSQIHKFYPIGLPGLTGFPGEEEYRAIGSNKIDKVISKESTPWTSLIAKLQMGCSFRIRDLAHRQFPSYSMEIIFGEQEERGIEIFQKLILNVSLLCARFTLFFEDEHRFKNYNTGAGTIPIYTVLSMEQNPLFERQQQFIHTIKKVVPEYFPDYTFLPHRSLFATDIQGGLPYPALYQDNFPFYTYLFDGAFTRSESIHILK
ncbi:hypothetical protein KTO58_14300 [Chitinophaga pendula]|uniref:hypothetical protein n=1 Tax=Chitinophaga TaxID=79328 RepID=UPI000BAF8752|nr:MULTISPECIES: hypothetical protein [Chitinophaga]ASZ12088.1 hypothetical protein CK934_14525 [Chitinophaga sp. MD30]UCJ04874.1 hypothetical protein KTO58_14300 [Chitinophaga pendula]